MICYYIYPNNFARYATEEEYSELGFESEILDQKDNLSKNVANILKTQKVYVSCDIAKGSYFNGKQTNIIFSFANTKRFGVPLTFSPTKRLPRQLLKKSFSKITFSFSDMNGKPVDFLKHQTGVTLEIKQM